MAKFYAVKQGRIPGIYLTWDQAKRQIDHFSGAVYKSFPTKAEAEAFMGGEAAAAAPAQPTVTNAQIQAAVDGLSGTNAIAFTDGSFDVRLKRYGYGAVVLHRAASGQLLSETFAQSFVHEAGNLRNVSGELLAVRRAISWAITADIDRLTIYYDYMGVEQWATKGWAANKPETKDYQRFIASVAGVIELRFVKVPAHTGISYNEQVDRLARGSLRTID